MGVGSAPGPPLLRTVRAERSSARALLLGRQQAARQQAGGGGRALHELAPPSVWRTSNT